MARFFVTGGSGFIGTNLVRSLLDNGHQVLNVDISPPRDPSLNAVWVEGDVRHRHTLSARVKDFRPQFIIHLASRTDLNGRNLADYAANYQGVENIIAAIMSVDTVDRVIFTSSQLVCRTGYIPQGDTDYRPNTLYGESKVMGEKIVREHADHLPAWAIIRPTSIWGPWFDTPYKEFFLSILNAYYVHPRGRRIHKSYGFVGNTVHMIESLITCDPSLMHGRTMYIADYPPLELKHWADQIAVISGKRPPLQVPYALFKMAALFGDLLKKLGWKEPPLTSFRLFNLVSEMVYDTSPIEHICGPLPYSNEEGIKKTIDWLSQKNGYV